TVGEAAHAQQVRGAHLEPGEVAAVVGHAHLVRLGVPHADRRAGPDGQLAASISRRAAASGSPLPYTALPATKTSPPASASARMLLASTPPSTSITVLRPRAWICARSRRTLSRLPGMKRCPLKPGLTDITRT